MPWEHGGGRGKRGPALQLLHMVSARAKTLLKTCAIGMLKFTLLFQEIQGKIGWRRCREYGEAVSWYLQIAWSRRRTWFLCHPLES